MNNCKFVYKILYECKYDVKPNLLLCVWTFWCAMFNTKLHVCEKKVSLQSETLEAHLISLPFSKGHGVRVTGYDYWS